MIDERDKQLFIQRPKRTSLPLIPLFAIFLIQFSEPVTGTVIHPFINQFVRSTGITDNDERKIGYFGGLLQSCFFLAEAATVFYWGRASDRFGRKPILLLGPLGLSLAMLAFGLSNNFWILVLCRYLQGVFNGNIGVSKTVMVEITDSSNVADAFAMTSLVWSAGITIGPIVGGVFSEPTTRWPILFGKYAFFVRHPYFLPCAVAALIAISSVPIGFLCLKETCQSFLLRKKWTGFATVNSSQTVTSVSTELLGNDSDIPNYGSNGSAKSDDSAECADACFDRPISSSPSQPPLSVGVLVVYGITSFMEMCVSALRPLVWSTSIHVGGLGMNAYDIGWIMGIWGILNASFQIAFLGPTIRRFGPRFVVLRAFACYIITFLLYPALSFFARAAGKVDSTVWTILLAQLMMATLSAGAFAGMQIVIVENAPKDSLGAANGLAQVVASALRGVAPAVASSLFSISLEKQLLGGQLAFYFLAFVGLFSFRLVAVLLSRT